MQLLPHTETSFGPAYWRISRTRRLSTRHHVKVESLLFVHSRPCSTAAHCTAMAITQHRSPSTQRHYTELRCTAPSTTLHAAHGALHCPCHTPRPPSAVLRPHRPPPPMRQARRALPPQGGTRGSLTTEYKMCAPGPINWCLEIEGTSPGPLGMLQQHCRPCGHSYKHFVGTAGRYRGRYHPAIPKTTHTEATGIWPHTAKRMQPGAWLLSMTSLNTPGHPVVPFGM